MCLWRVFIYWQMFIRNCIVFIWEGKKWYQNYIWLLCPLLIVDTNSMTDMEWYAVTGSIIYSTWADLLGRCFVLNICLIRNIHTDLECKQSYVLLSDLLSNFTLYSTFAFYFHFYLFSMSKPKQTLLPHVKRMRINPGEQSHNPARMLIFMKLEFIWHYSSWKLAGWV